MDIVASAASCPLLNLPLELRNRIYENLLGDDGDDEPVVIRDWWTPVILDDDVPCWSSPAILQTCRRMRDEALPMYACLSSR
jgi:hypothetical protein